MGQIIKLHGFECKNIVFYLLHRPKRKMRQKITLFFDNVIAPLQY